MGKEAVFDCVASLKIKNSEGYDIIPQRIIKDGVQKLIKPFTSLLKLIYETKTIPDQWRITKVRSIPKKDKKLNLQLQTNLKSLLNFGGL